MNRSLGELTYDELCVIVQRIWKSKLSTDINNLVLKYVDDEGDQICLENDNDVNHALSLSSCLKIHVYDKETIPVNTKSLIPKLSLEEKTLESIKNIVKNSRDTLNNIIEQLEKIKVEAPAQVQGEKEIKPLSNAELSEFLGDQNDATKTSEDNNASAPAPFNEAVNDQTISSAPLTADTTTNAAAPSLDQVSHQGSIVQTPNSMHPTLASQPPAVSTFNQTTNTPQINQTQNSSNMNAQSFASPTTAYQSSQNASQPNASSTMGTSGSQPPYQKTNSFSSNMSSQPVTQASTTSSNMYASAPPPTYGSSYTSTAPPPSQYGNTTNNTSQYGSTSNTSQYGSGTASTSAPPPTSSSQFPQPPSSTASSTAQYPPTSSASVSNPSSYQRYPQTPTYGSSSMPGTSVPPPPQSSTYSNQGMQKNPYGYGSTPYGQASSAPYGSNPYGSYSNNQNQYRPNNAYGQSSNNPYY
eukprot:jgi/Orpsp1_1/1174828/evm.model.c7180000051585.1